MTIRTDLFARAVLGVSPLSGIGCSSVAVKNDDLEQRTGFALGLDRGQFAISNRTDLGVRTDYSVKTKGGESFRCYVTGGVSGRQPQSSGQPCNALLQAAGKCQ